MIEWYDLVAFGKPRTPEQDLEFLRNAILLAKSGRIVWIKAWPYPYSFLDKAFQAKSYAEKVAAMNNGALFNIGIVPGGRSLRLHIFALLLGL